MTRQFYFSIVLCFAGVLLSGCWDAQHGDIQEWLVVQKMEVQPKIRPLQEPSIFSPQRYEATEEMDPFNMLKLTQALSRDSAQNMSNMGLLFVEQNRRKDELENFPLDSMSMVGFLRKNGKDTALLRVNNLIYQVSVGNYLGQNYGRINQIEENGIKLREIVQDAGGDWVERVTKLDLQEGGK